ncbi:MAG: hypothetical protein GY768_26215 [Planctomycetaceae bacterium]|nr:hypothetical protein [Planctomycetaceae bacterium]
MTNASKFRIAAAVGGIAFIGLLAFFTSGDSDQQIQVNSPQLSSSDASRRRDFDQGFDFLKRLDEFELAEARQRILYHLRQWLKRQSADPDWTVDALAEQQGLVSNEQLAPLNLENYDVQVLQEATWMRDVARNVIEENALSPDLKRLIESAAQKLDETTANDLSHVTQLFDWTVRNLLLDVENAPGDTNRTASPVILQAWESLQMGRGTVQEKSRVFMLLARQMGLPVVMLAVEKTSGEIEPWVPAAFLGGKLFLFDMRLATPLLGADRSIATLEDVIDDPGILQQMGEQSGSPYPIQGKQLSSVVALIDATPGYLSQRMAVLEQQLMGENKMVLTVAPTLLAQQLAKTEKIKAVGVWQMPYEGFAIRESLASMPESIRWLSSEYRLFDRRTPLIQARILHLRGRYDPTEDLPGARQYYLECRRPNSEIEAIDKIPIGEGKTPEQVAAYQQRLDEVQSLMIRTKQSATYWLGLIAFERGEYQVAANYFEKRLIEAYPGSMWISGAKYNLGRCYEAMGVRDQDQASLDKAIEIYKSVENSPMTPACTWRAAWVRSQTPGEDTAEGELLPRE